MICIPKDKEQDILAYFREQMPEFAAITDEVFYRLLHKVALYVPEFI